MLVVMRMISSNIRIPEELWNQLRQLAYEEKRSINSELIYIIEKYIEEKMLLKSK